MALDPREFPGYDRQTVPKEGSPHGWVQWKGTTVCIDIRCSCGELSHFDGEFLYYVQCPHCERVYMTNGHVELVPLTDEEKKWMEDGGGVKRAS